MAPATIAPSRGLAREQGGAIMVLGVFMAALMVGVLYYALGIGDAIALRERIQDAADAGVYASGIVHARAMNLVALINICMVVVCSIGGTARLVGIMAALAGGAGADGKAQAIEDAAVSALRAANAACDALVDTIPTVAAAEATAAAAAAYQPLAEVFVYGRRTLAIEDGSTALLAEKANLGLFSIASLAFSDDERQRIYQQSDASVLSVLAYGAIVQIAQTAPPQRVPSDAVPGGERFQVRLVVGTDQVLDRGDRGVGVAGWGATEEHEEEVAALRAIGRIGLAQAEYFYDGTEPRAEWLWMQNWRARLRRVTLGAPDGYPCLDASPACDALDGLFVRGLHGAIVH